MHMNEEPSVDPEAIRAIDHDLPELELSDQDIPGAMDRIPGYLDITATDFRAICRREDSF